MIVGLLGKAGSGKDTVADALVKSHGFVKVAFADPLKRICRDVFDFSVEQLWGPSEKRNEPDERYPRGTIRLHGRDGVDTDHVQYLTPRLALQLLGTEWGRHCYPNIWLDYALRTAKTITENSVYRYSAQHGLIRDHGNRMADTPVEEREPYHVVISDVRFLNEVEGIKAAGGLVVRVTRPVVGLTTGGHHISETEQDSIPEAVFDWHFQNNGTLVDVSLQVDATVEGLKSIDAQRRAR